MNILKYSDINIKNIQYDKPEKKGTYYYSAISYDKNPLLVQTIKLKCNNSKEEILKNIQLKKINLLNVNLKN